VCCCDEALACQAGGEAALKAWLRRSKANLGRHEFKVGPFTHTLCCSLNDSPQATCALCTAYGMCSSLDSVGPWREESNAVHSMHSVVLVARLVR
jgi:hypothetical protein